MAQYFNETLTAHDTMGQIGFMGRLCLCARGALDAQSLAPELRRLLVRLVRESGRDRSQTPHQRQRCATATRAPSANLCTHREASPSSWRNLDAGQSIAFRNHLRVAESAASQMFYSAPDSLPTITVANRPEVELLATIRKATRGACVYMRMQEYLSIADSDPSAISVQSLGLAPLSQEPGDLAGMRGTRECAYHPRRMAARLAEELRPLGVGIDELPDAMRAATHRLGPSLDTTARHRIHAGASFWQNRKSSLDWMAATNWKPVGRVALGAPGLEEAYQMRAIALREGPGEMLLWVENQGPTHMTLC